ncbi:hypothetical protein JTB14_003928 [Gonioctena quinquepunctata]|nr:hypothetical protein JTB14_003928 [Gonioctena quinquepunctata]
MEPTEVIIARLVLGYLKREHCKNAYEEFLRKSHSLGKLNLNRSKYIPTRFVGLTLEDILTEYFEIYQIIQGRLEPTDYYNEGRSKTSLVKQLLYLLNKVHSSRASTPCSRSPTDSHLCETSPSYIGHASDVEATPAHTLPGNIQFEGEEVYPHKSRRKSHNAYGAVTSSPLMDKDDVSEVLAQTLLENKEFHEKIAQTINKVAEKQSKSSAELDKTIRNVVKQTEEDPIFDRILEEIIGSSNHLDDQKATETSSTASSIAQGNDCQAGHRKSDTSGTTEKDNNPVNVDQQNDEAIRSIVASSKMAPDAQQKVEQGNNEVVVFDGSLDKYLQTDSAAVTMVQPQPVQNSLYINTTATLFIPTNVHGYPSNNPGNQLVVLNKQPSVNWTAPGIITEKDILTMPTVILTDHGPTMQSNPIPPAQAEPEGQHESIARYPSRKPILPGPKPPLPRIQVTADLSEFLQLNNYEDDKPKKGLRKVHYPRASAKFAPPATFTAPSAVSMAPPDVSTVLPDVSTALPVVSTALPVVSTAPPSFLRPYLLFLRPHLLLLPSTASSTYTTATSTTSSAATTTTSSEVADEKKDSISKTSKQVNLIEEKCTKTKDDQAFNAEEPRACTPPLLQAIKTATPKSGSHIRNLDFSSPPKITSTHKKAPESNKDPGVWDADLRVNCPQMNFIKKADAKRKRTNSSSNSKQSESSEAADPKEKCETSDEKKPRKKVKNNVNTTQDDGALVEAALIDLFEDREDEEKPEKDQECEREKAPELKKPAKKKKTAALLDLFEDKDQECEKEKATEPVKRQPKKKKTAARLDLFGDQEDEKKPEKEKATEPVKKQPKKKKTAAILDLFGDQEDEKKPEKDQECEKEKATEPVKRQLKKKKSDKSTVTNAKAEKKKRELDKSKEAEEKPSLITPEMLRENHALPMKANRNLMPLLETPLKEQMIPKTPGLMTPLDMNVSAISNITPFSKMLEDNLKGIDIGSIATPSIPITPNFTSITPTVDLLSPFSNRPTDYSAGSSYYVPSDNEQNKSLEAQLREFEMKSPVMESIKSIFNKHVIGKKNLSLMKRDTPSPDSSTGSSSSETEDEGNSFSNWDEKESNDTVILKKKEVETPKRTYSLRNRSVNQDSTMKVPKSRQRKYSADKKKVEAKKVIRKPKPTTQNSDSEENKDDAETCKVATTKVSKKTKNEVAGEAKTKKNIQKSDKVTTKEECNTSKKSVAKTSHKKRIVFQDFELQEKEEEKMEEKVDTKEEKHVKKPIKRARKLSRVSDAAKETKKESLEEPGVLEETKETEGKKPRDNTSQTELEEAISNILREEIDELKIPKEVAEKGESLIDKLEEKKNSGKLLPETVDFEPQEKMGSIDKKNEALVKANEPEKSSRVVTAEQSLFLKELAEKRQRIMKTLKNKSDAVSNKSTSKKQPNGKFKIKPIPNLFSARKRPRKSDSPRKKIQPNLINDILEIDLRDSDSSEDEFTNKMKVDTKSEPSKTENNSKTGSSASDVEAQTLIEGLKERGIHLMQNKSPKKKSDEEFVQEVENIEDTAECSASQIDTFVRETYDMKSFEGEDRHFIFDGRQIEKTIESPKKIIKFIGKVYLEAIGGEIDVPLFCTPFETLLDIPSEEDRSDIPESKRIIIKEVVILKAKNEDCPASKSDEAKEGIGVDTIEGVKETDGMADDKCETKDYSFTGENTVDDDLMNFASTGKDKSDKEDSVSPSSTKKRKLTEENDSHKEKKAKKLLKKIDVDSFLTKIHAGNKNFYSKK